jgi:hypothetical protein
MDITSWIIFACFNYIRLGLHFIQAIVLKISINIEDFQHMEYIRDKMIPIIVWKKLSIYFKTKVVDGILGWIFFMVYDIDIHQLNIGNFRNLKFLDEISLKKCVFLHLFSSECIIISNF